MCDAVHPLVLARGQQTWPQQTDPVPGAGLPHTPPVLSEGEADAVLGAGQRHEAARRPLLPQPEPRARDGGREPQQLEHGGVGDVGRSRRQTQILSNFFWAENWRQVRQLSLELGQAGHHCFIGEHKADRGDFRINIDNTIVISKSQIKLKLI